MKEFVCRFPDDIHEKLREESFLRKKSMADIVREAMHDYCQNKAAKPIPSTINASPTKKNPLTASITQLSTSCLQKIWDNEEDDFFNDL
ncbi:hypothetical protein LLG10_08425 [bacterium]|nr:hypothetical protein [bacterium]